MAKAKGITVGNLVILDRGNHVELMFNTVPAGNRATLFTKGELPGLISELSKLARPDGRNAPTEDDDDFSDLI